MLHGSETWGPNALDLKRLRRNDRAMIRWICGTKVHDKTTPALLLKKYNGSHLQWAVGVWHVMGMCSVPHPVSNLSQTFHFPAQKEKKA